MTIPQPGPVVPPAGPSTPQRPHHPARLPWVLVVILSVAVVGLTALVTLRERQIGELTGQLAAATAAPATPTAAPAPSASAQPTPAPSTADPELEEFLLSLQRREPDDPRALGAVDAPVVLIEWSDFRCPYCARFATTTFTDLLPYVESGSLRVEFRDMAMFGDESELAAVASRAAGEQGKFWEFSHALFAAAPASGHPEIGQADVIGFAKAAGVPDLEAFTAALDDEDLLQAVREDTQHAQGIGITGTPFFVVNTTPISGAQPLEVFTATIEGYGGTK